MITQLFFDKLMMTRIQHYIEDTHNNSGKSAKFAQSIYSITSSVDV